MNPKPQLCTAAQLAEAVKGKLLSGDASSVCTSVSTDSRTPSVGSLFIALRGPNFDGARFCQDAVRSGSSMVILDQGAWKKGLAKDLGETAVIVVQDSLQCLGDLAAWYRSKFDVKTVAVTGSNGKTSTKEMITSVLGGLPDVLSTQGNFNNLIGLPLTLFELNDHHRYAVLEMGMNRLGEIARLSEIAKPKIGIVTNVHPAHLEGLGSLEAVGRAKGELLEALPEDAAAIINVDDPYVLKQVPRCRAQKIGFGWSPHADVRVLSADQPDGRLLVRFSVFGTDIEVTFDRPGLYNAMNVASAAAVGFFENVPVDVLARRLSITRLPAMRMERLNLGSGRLLVDCYNANPLSMEAALNTVMGLSTEKQKTAAVLGEMRELGDATEQFHRQIGRKAATIGLGGLCVFGSAAKPMAEGAKEKGMSDVLHTESLSEAVQWSQDKLSTSCWLLIKGSRAMNMERIAIRLAESFGTKWTP